MNESARDSSGSPSEVYPVAVARLRSRAAEVAQAIHAGIPAPATDLAVAHDADEYRDGRAVAIAAIVEYSLDAIERGDQWGPIPQALAAQVHRAARIGVKPGVLIRRYLAGHRRFMDFFLEEVKRSCYADHDAMLEHLRGTYRSLLEHIIASIEREYDQECERIARSPEQRRVKFVQRLLVEDVDPAELKEMDYEVLSQWHLGMIAVGGEGAEALRRLKTASGRGLLCVPGHDGTVWAWLGRKHKLTFAQFKRLLSANGCSNAPLAIGDPGNGLEGWRQTHHEAQVAVLIARHELCGPTRCADILPVAGALQNKAIVRMYKETYILPLNKLYKGGQPARKALLAYFKHGRNASSAGDAIHVTRRTVQNHLNDARRVLDAPLNLTGLEIALLLEELGYMPEAEDRSTEYPVSVNAWRA
jgi:hypothetical protein